MNKGLIHIYTGTGKGKTTAAVGLAVRALSHNLKVCYCSINKNPDKYGITEVRTLQKLGAKVIAFTDEHPSFNSEITKDQHTERTQKSFLFLKELMAETSFDVLILDEIIISVRDFYLQEDDLIDFLKAKPEHLEIILTGRGASTKLMELAHYVSEINAVKHPMNVGIFAREGIEY